MQLDSCKMTGIELGEVVLITVHMKLKILSIYKCEGAGSSMTWADVYGKGWGCCALDRGIDVGILRLSELQAASDWACSL